MSQRGPQRPIRPGTQRGRNNPPPRPRSPPDPSLETDPVPPVRDRTTFSIGRGARPDARSHFRTISELRKLTRNDGRDHYDSPQNLIRLVDRFQLVNDVGEEFETPEIASETHRLNQIPDRTWGFYVFVTDYSKPQDNVTAAIEKIIASQQLGLEVSTGPGDIIADEATLRFRLEVVMDEATLSGASIDRVREEFRSLVRARRPDFVERGPPLPARNWVCIMLDGETTHMLNALVIPSPSDVKKGTPNFLANSYMFDQIRLTIVDGYFFPDMAAPDYPGWKKVSVWSLESLYEEITGDGCSGALEDFAP